MANIDFTKLLDQQIGSTPELKALPAGTYVGMISEPPTVMTRKTKDGTERPIIVVQISLNEALDDVDPEELSEAGGLQGRTVRNEIWRDSQAETGWSRQLESFLGAFGFAAGCGKTYAEGLADLVSREVTVTLERRDYIDKKTGAERATNDVKAVVPA